VRKYRCLTALSFSRPYPRSSTLPCFIDLLPSLRSPCARRRIGVSPPSPPTSSVRPFPSPNVQPEWAEASPDPVNAECDLHRSQHTGHSPRFLLFRKPPCEKTDSSPAHSRELARACTKIYPARHPATFRRETTYLNFFLKALPLPDNFPGVRTAFFSTNRFRDPHLPPITLLDTNPAEGLCPSLMRAMRANQFS